MYSAAMKNSELRTYSDEIAALDHSVDSILNNLTDAQVNWRPDPNKWSISECLDHLVIGNRERFEKFQSVIEESRNAGRLASGPFKRNFLHRMLIKSLEPPVKQKIKAKPLYAPAQTMSVSKARENYHQMHQEFRDVMLKSDGLDFSKMKIQSAFSKLIKMPLGTWFAFLLAHERRHVWQAQQVRNHPDFPRS